MSALLGNLATVLQQMQKPPAPLPGKKKPQTPTPVAAAPGSVKPRGTLLTGADAPVPARKTLLGS